VFKISCCKSPRRFLRARLSQLVACAALISSSTLAIAQAGHLDGSFGTGGIFTSNFGGPNTAVNAVALQSDGKIVVGGAGGPGGKAGLARITTHGTLDTSFGTGGIVTSKFNSLAAAATVVALAIQLDGKIVAAANGIPARFAVGRFNADGSVDTTFGTSGFVQVGNAGGALLLALQPDGKIVVAGNTQMARLTSDGELDTSFGTAGLAVLLAQFPSGIALQSDGKILIASGGFSPPAVVLNPPPGAGSLARYNSNGSLDQGFGISGEAASVALPYAMEVQRDGKILVAGGIISKLITTGNASGFGVVRFDPNGSIDTTFGTRGGATTGFGSLTLAGAFGLAIQSNGDIVAAGEAGTVGTQLTLSFGLTRYLTSGQLDTKFGTGGKVTTTFGSNGRALISGVVLQTDGKIVVAGDANSNFAVARYLAQ
jgi:uncharacterized delta-60 repeat protein